MTDWSFDAWPAVEPKWHDGAQLGEYDQLEFHVDLGCGKLKKGRIGIDHYPAPGVNVVMDLDAGIVGALSEAPGEDADWPYPGPVDFGASRGYQRAQGIGEVRALSHGLPFEDSSVESIISHHALEHIGEGFISLVGDVYRVLKPGGLFRAITPLFPSYSAAADPDHCRHFMEGTWDLFCGTPGDTPQNCWLASFSVPYSSARFTMLEQDMTPRCEPEDHWTPKDAREIRVALRAEK